MQVKILKKAKNSTDSITVNQDNVRQVFSNAVKVLKKANKPIKPRDIKPATLRQAQVVAMVAKGSKSKARILREAGYSEAVARQPGKVFKSPIVKKEVETILQALEKERDAIIKEMRKKRHRAAYKDLGNVLDKVLSKIELLSGKPTDRFETPIDPKDKAMFAELFRNHS